MYLVVIFNQVKSPKAFIFIYPKRRETSVSHISLKVCFPLLFPGITILSGQSLHITRSHWAIPQVFETYLPFIKKLINSKADFSVLFNPPCPMSLISLKLRAMCLILADKVLHDKSIMLISLISTYHHSANLLVIDQLI